MACGEYSLKFVVSASDGVGLDIEMTEASQVRARIRHELGTVLRLVPFSWPTPSPYSAVPDFYWRHRSGTSGWLEAKLIVASGRCPAHFTLDQLMWGEEEVAWGGRWHLLGLVQSRPTRWWLFDTVGARRWFDGLVAEPVVNVVGGFPTREVLRALISPAAY